MDDKTWIGAVSESAVIKELVGKKYDVFISFTGKSECDLIAVKNSSIKRIQVKGCNTITKYGSFSVQLRSIRSNKTKNIIYKFDSARSDILAVYIIPLDEVYFFNSYDLHEKSILTISSNGKSNSIKTICI